MGFDDIIWDVEPTLQVYDMVLPHTLITLVVLVAVLFLVLLGYNYFTGRGLSTMPWHTDSDHSTVHYTGSNMLHSQPYYHAAAQSVDDRPESDEWAERRNVQMMDRVTADNSPSSVRIRDRVEHELGLR